MERIITWPRIALVVALIGGVAFASYFGLDEAAQTFADFFHTLFGGE